MNELLPYKPQTLEKLQSVRDLQVTNEESKKLATELLARMKLLEKEIKKVGEKPIKDMEGVVKRLKKDFKETMAPLKEAEALLREKIGTYYMSEQQAAKELQYEAIETAIEKQEVPEEVVGTAKTEDVEGGRVSVRELETFDIEGVVVDGKPLPHANLGFDNSRFKDFPKAMFHLHIPTARDLIMAGILLPGVRKYKKPSVSFTGD